MTSLGSIYLRARSKFQGDGLHAKALRGSTWSTLGHGAQQLLRLASNMIMARLLFPDAFGLISLAYIFMTGLEMFSDVGIQPSIIRSKRGEDIHFLNTAWTLQVIRGFVLWAISCLLAYPASLLYNEPQLFPVLCLIGSTSAIRGFQTTGYASSNRKLQFGKLTMAELIAQLLGSITMIIWAVFSPTVWALAIGGVVSSCAVVALAHRWLNTHRHQFAWDRSAVSELIHFGKWIFLATALTYIGGQGLRLVQGALVSIETIGVISIASMFALALSTLVGKINTSVLFPVFSDTQRRNPQQLAGQLIKSRKLIFLMTCPAFLVLILFSQPIISLLYDERYHAAGLYLMVMAVGAAMSSLRDPFGMTLLAIGDSASHFINMIAMATFRLSGVFIGYRMGGVLGMLIADVIAEACVYPVEAYRLRKHNLWFPAFDIFSYAFYALVGVLSYHFLFQ
ncbi:MAG: oligosaccharide flippase family protein [Spongiibacteraceae bacterium]